MSSSITGSASQMQPEHVDRLTPRNFQRLASYMDSLKASGQMEGNIAELSVRALCSNRHLPEQLPVGEGYSGNSPTSSG